MKSKSKYLAKLSADFEKSAQQQRPPQSSNPLPLEPQDQREVLDNNRQWNSNSGSSYQYLSQLLYKEIDNLNQVAPYVPIQNDKEDEYVKKSIQNISQQIKTLAEYCKKQR